MLKNIDWDVIKAILLILVIVSVFAFLDRPLLVEPDVKIEFPANVPEDIHGVYWLLLKGSAGVNLPGVHTHMISPSDPDWVRVEAMWVEPEFMYEWRWEYKGETMLGVQAVPGMCYQIGEQKLKVEIWDDLDNPYWGYKVTDCSLLDKWYEDLFGKKY